MAVEYITPKEAAAILRVHERTVRRWIREGRIRTRRFGRLIRIQKSEIEPSAEQPAWASSESFREDWSNPLDADYDKWREAYGVR